MFLNQNFNPKIESIILLSEPLTDWFERNQETMAYFELTHMGCLHFEESAMVSNDIRVLGRMANHALTWLEGNYALTQMERAEGATSAIAGLYELEKDGLTEQAKKLYAIDVELEKTETPKTKVLTKKNGTKNRRPGKGHRRH